MGSNIFPLENSHLYTVHFFGVSPSIFAGMTFIAPHFQKAKKNAFFAFFRKDRILVRTPWWLKQVYPTCVWDINGDDKKLYLSFDDGPHPTITPFVLGELKKHNAKATFFCIGENVQKYPELYQRYIDEGHAVGNHTQHHINGWKTGDKEYLEDIKAAGQYIQSNLFRPPYGRISRSQIKKIHQAIHGQKIVMWNILAGDWVPELAPEKCYDRIQRRISGGDIIVLHESDKAWDRMSYVLPRLLDDFSAKGNSFQPIHLK